MDNQLYYQGELIDLGENLENVNCARLSVHGWEAQALIRQGFIRNMCLLYATTRQARLAEKVAEFLDNWLQQRPLVLLPDLSPELHILTGPIEHNAMGLGRQMIHWLEVLYSAGQSSPDGARHYAADFRADVPGVPIAEQFSGDSTSSASKAPSPLRS